MNGARADFKRAVLFKLMEIKKINSSTDNESEWSQAFNGEVVSNRSGVGSFLPVSFDSEEMIPGVVLKVKATFENVQLVFLNVCTPTNALAFLNILNETVKNCKDNDFLFLNGGFNCTETALLDRNHSDSRVSSSRITHR